MQKEFEMSMFGEMSFFLSLQVTQLDDGILFLKLSMLKKFDMENHKPVTIPLDIGCKLGKMMHLQILIKRSTNL